MNLIVLVGNEQRVKVDILISKNILHPSSHPAITLIASETLLSPHATSEATAMTPFSIRMSLQFIAWEYNPSLACHIAPPIKERGTNYSSRQNFQFLKNFDGRSTKFQSP